MILHGDALEILKTLPDGSANCCVTSPPYWGLRDYGAEGQLGLEKTPEEYVEKITGVFREVKRVLKKDGTLWLNLGDSYSGSGKSKGTELGGGSKQVSNHGSLVYSHNGVVPRGMKPKDLVGIPWSVAFALRADGWYLRSDIIWHKPNPMPESVTDRPTKAHEYIFLLAKSEKYFFDSGAIKEGATYDGPNGVVKSPHGQGFTRSGNVYRKQRPSSDVLQKGAQAGSIPWQGNTRNRRTVWKVSTRPFKGAHFATFPEKLIEPCILAGCPKGGIVLDPFFGAGTVGVVAKKFNRGYLGIELNPEYIAMAEKRIAEKPKETKTKVLFHESQLHLPHLGGR